MFPAIPVSQPLGTFYACALPASLLLRVCYPLPARAKERIEDESAPFFNFYRTSGSQRPQKKGRLSEICSFIQSDDAAFPNAMILAANYGVEGLPIEHTNQLWHYDNGKLMLPQVISQSMSIIDGQHRLTAFQKLPDDAPEREMELLCSIYLELPSVFHAYLFATINFNQKKVDRSLAYELFGSEADARDPREWSPDTVAVVVARHLRRLPDSPLRNMIRGALKEEPQFKSAGRISIASVVDGILSLLSKNPRRDRSILREKGFWPKTRVDLPKESKLPARDLYLTGNDQGIYDLVSNYFTVVSEVLWSGADQDSYYRKTVGIQALFDVLRSILQDLEISVDSCSKDGFRERLRGWTALAHEDREYEASGIGRTQIKMDLLSKLNAQG